MAEDRSRIEAEQLNKSPQERRQGDRNEQELQHNENNSETENTDESNETFNILENEIIANESTDIGIRDTYNEYHEGGGVDDVHQARRGRNHNIGGNSIYSNKSKRAGISKVGNKYYKKSSVPFLLSLLLQPVMEEDDGSNRYSATNEIIDHDGAADVGIFEPPTQMSTGATPSKAKVAEEESQMLGFQAVTT
ncbi:hypothetical protein Prudu_162S000100 [Prunus dulcis]|uniref:Uncharacterized protein n=1 Tax=Prunus dulcis TaxID=3755 RepID=A0A5H2XH32_PRUDU|nr:hypothetical protein Prudu_162S000100 [Prunus dulcis]